MFLFHLLWPKEKNLTQQPLATLLRKKSILTKNNIDIDFNTYSWEEMVEPSLDWLNVTIKLLQEIIDGSIEKLQKKNRNMCVQLAICERFRHLCGLNEHYDVMKFPAFCRTKHYFRWSDKQLSIGQCIVLHFFKISSPSYSFFLFLWYSYHKQEICLPLLSPVNHSPNPLN